MKWQNHVKVVCLSVLYISWFFKFFILFFYFLRCLKLFADDFDSMLKSILDDDDKPKRKSSLVAATGSPNATIQPSDKKDEQSTSAGCC